MSERTGWEHYELEKEMADSNMAQLLELFKRESDKFSSKCSELFTNFGKLTEEGKKQIEEDATLINEGRQKIALTIAEILTDTKRIPNE